MIGWCGSRAMTVAAAVAVALAVAAALRTLADARTEIDLFLFNSDFLFPAAIYHDLFLDGYGLDGLQFSAATLIVPDVLLFFPIRALIGSTPAAIVPWCFVLVAVTVAGAAAAGATVLPHAARSQLPAALLSFVAIAFADGSLQFFQTSARELFRPLSHNGILGGSLFGFALVVGCLRAESPRRRAAYWVSLALLCMACMFSDRWFGVWFAAPIGVAVAVCRWLVPPPATFVTVRSGAFVLSAIAVGSALGLVGLRYVLGPDGDRLDRYWQDGPDWSGVGRRGWELVLAVANEVWQGNVFAAVGVLWYPLAVWVVVGRGTNREPAFVLYCLMTLGVGGFGVALFLVSPTADFTVRDSWGAYCRYFQGPLGVGFFGWPIWLAGRDFWVRAVVVVAVVLAALAWAAPRNADRNLLAYRPTYVEALDEACVRHNIGFGFTGYWQAKQITYLSQTGLVARQVVSGDEDSPYKMEALRWLSNARWYWQRPGGAADDIRYEFFLVRDEPLAFNGPPTRTVVAVFGEPAHREPTGPYTLLVYNRASDVRVHRLHETESSFRKLRERFGPRDDR